MIFSLYINTNKKAYMSNKITKIYCGGTSSNHMNLAQSLHKGSSREEGWEEEMEKWGDCYSQYYRKGKRKNLLEIDFLHVHYPKQRFYHT